MTKKQFLELLSKKRVILDGATGSNLSAAGMPVGVCPEQWILENPEALIGLQLQYLEAGTDILYAPTFSGNRIKLAEYGLEEQAEEMNTRLVGLSQEAVKRYCALQEEKGSGARKVFVAADLTMTGKQLAPIGTLDFEELVDVYKEQLRYVCTAGADLIVVETMMSLQECRAAVLAAKETCELPVMVTLTFGEDGRTLFGTAPDTAMVVLQSMGADAVGLNCSTGPDKMCEIVEKMQSVAEIPLIVKPNAGLPVLKDGKTVYDMTPEQFTEHMKVLLDMGASLVGGCCGTTPEHIRALADCAKEYAPYVPEAKEQRILTTERNLLKIDLDGRFLVIGERINPTGKKALQTELKAGSLEMVRRMAEEQLEQGADVLDINLGMNGIDEKAMLLQVMEEVEGLVDLPLCIDSSHQDIIEAALRRYPGRALINSISLEPGKLEQLLPAAKKYGAMFILLPLSEQGLPKNLEEKKTIIRTIYDAALRYGLRKTDIIVDGLVNTVGANKEAALQTLETIRYCKEELEVATVCGLSNISFGLPERQYVNATFLAFAIQAGITMAILNPAQDMLMNMAYAADLLKNKEEADVRYIERATAKPMTLVETAAWNRVKELAAGGNGAGVGSNGNGFGSAAVGENGSENAGAVNSAGKGVMAAGADALAGNAAKARVKPPVFDAVMKGNRRMIVELVKQELAKGQLTPSELLDTQLIAAINEVGDLFNRQKYFLPQLIASAEAMKTAIEYLEPQLAAAGSTEKLGVVVIATVAGDIHDIGKNLVTLMLKNYGFEVIDLGKDVPTEEIIRVAAERNADIIGISALMTTTMQEMKEVVRQRNEAGLRAKVMIGGAVITQSYCDEIGADGYAKDAQEAVSVAKQLLCEDKENEDIKSECNCSAEWWSWSKDIKC